ncbi:hypothetical protein V5O48_013026 [Marasmius crinis-equi]|uniref:Uncharacterized protein n=1 Tax=Marasmius crinis-equi TaxID=585013 RepID=A0ABR3F1D2_9AGAR
MSLSAISAVAEILGNLGDFAWPIIGFYITYLLVRRHNSATSPTAPLLPTHTQSIDSCTSDGSSATERTLEQCSEGLKKSLELLYLTSRGDTLNDDVQIEELSVLLDQHEVLENILSDGRRHLQNGTKRPPQEYDAVVQDVKYLGWTVDKFASSTRRDDIRRTGIRSRSRIGYCTQALDSNSRQESCVTKVKHENDGKAIDGVYGGDSSVQVELDDESEGRKFSQSDLLHSLPFPDVDCVAEECEVPDFGWGHDCLLPLSGRTRPRSGTTGERN